MSSFRIPFAIREKSAYIMLRRKQLSINQIATCFGRSTSVVHRALQKLKKYGCRLGDLRKLPYHKRNSLSKERMLIMMEQQDSWALWVCGEEGEPP